MPAQNPARAEFTRGFKDTLPLVIGAVPFGILFGALAVSAGISPAGTMGLSLFVFAGASQFLAAGLFAEGAGTLVIILTTFIVNLRHALYATTLGAHLQALPQRWLIPLGFWLTDESFAVAAQRFSEPDPGDDKHWYLLGSEIFMYTNWQLCTLIGIILGRAIPDPAGWGLDFAMSVTFIGLVVPLLRTRPVVVCAAAAGVTAVLANGLPHRLGLLSGALVGIALGMLVERQQENRRDD
ncbi:MAG TPA: AzlC family ABC transporter permease [Anaerolineales bacterium]|nr:AzlC family ABC transporter permease [Anaerolineales bacterium]